jgi:adenylylsulfate kinase
LAAATLPPRPPAHGVTVWFTGLPSAGKTTIAGLVGRRLAEHGLPVEVLDGDVVRAHLSRGLGFSKADRDENIRRIGYVAGLLTGHGVTVLVSAISPYRAVRDEVRAAIECVGGFVEVHVATDLATCRARDVKGLYAKHARGELRGLTGVDDPYEPPLTPELVLDTATETPQESAARVLELLGAAGETGRAAAAPALGAAVVPGGATPVPVLVKGRP